MNKKYLIILLNYNNWQDTIECIHSLKSSAVDDSNILIIENCSTDNSEEKLKENSPRCEGNAKQKKSGIYRWK